MRKARAAGHIHTWIVHRVREEWVPWWQGLPSERQKQFEADLASLSAEDEAWFLQMLRATIEADSEAGTSAAHGPGSADWVFMQFAHIEPLEASGLFAASRLDQPGGFKALCLHPNKSLLIKVTLLRRGPDPAHYEYNVRLTNTVGVKSALAAVNHLLKSWNRVFFCGRPRGCSHHPLALRLPLSAALILGPSCIIAVYAVAAVDSLSDALLLQLLYGAGLCGLVTLVFWLFGIVSDTLAERRLAGLLGNILSPLTSKWIMVGMFGRSPLIAGLIGWTLALSATHCALAQTTVDSQEPLRIR